MSEVNLSTDETRVSYGIGRQLGDQLRDNPPPGISLDAILAGLTDAFAGKESRVGQEEMSASFKVIREIMQAEAAAKAEAAAGEGKAFLAENAKKDGITTLASGLQFEVVTAGEGAKPSREDTVRVHYHGTLIDGTVFDSSYDRGQPAEFPVGGVIAGWTEALQLMNAGSKWRIYVPRELAYGAQGVGSIAPHRVGTGGGTRAGTSLAAPLPGRASAVTLSTRPCTASINRHRPSAAQWPMPCPSARH